MNWKALLGTLISAAFLVLAFRKANLHEIKLALAQADYVFLIPAVLLALLSVLVRAIRWRFLLLPVKRIGILSLFSATVIGMMANNLLPARLGEIVRAYAIGQKEQISKSSSLATIVIERLFDGLMLLLFLAIVLLFFSISSPGWLGNAAYAALAMYLVVLVVLILLKVRTERFVRIVTLICKPLPERFSERILHILHSFIDGLKILNNARYIIASLLLTFFVWLPNVLVIHILLISFGINLPLFASFLLIVALGIGVMIPSAPGFVGTIQFVCVAALALFAVTRSEALSFSMIYHASVFIPVTFVGLVFMFIERVSFSEVRSSTWRQSKKQS